MAGGGGRLSRHRAGRIQARFAARHGGRGGAVGRGGNVQAPQPGGGPRRLVVALSPCAGIWGAQRSCVSVLVDASRAAGDADLYAVGAPAGAGALRARLMAVPARGSASSISPRSCRWWSRSAGSSARAAYYPLANTSRRHAQDGDPSPIGGCRRCSGSIRAIGRCSRERGRVSRCPCCLSSAGANAWHLPRCSRSTCRSPTPAKSS